jgi:Flp pilus assembly protein TadG
MDLAGKNRAMRTRRFRNSRVLPARDERGSTLVEMALSISVLVSVVVGIMALSLALYSYFYISDAAREATRYAIVRGNDQTGDCTSPGLANCIAQIADIQDYVRSLGFPGIASGNLNVATTWLTSTGAACGATDSCKAAGNLVKSTVTYTYGLVIPFLSTRTLTMTSKSQMVVAY